MSSADAPVVGIFQVVRSSWLVVVSSVLIGAGLASLGWSLWPTQYQARAVVEVASPGDDTDASVNMETQAEIAASTGVLEAAVEDTDVSGGWTVGGLSDSLAVTVPRGAQVLQLTVTAGSPDAAADAANAVAEAYLQDRDRVSSQALSASLEDVEDQIAEAQSQLDAATTPGARLTIQSRLADLDQQRASLQAPDSGGGRVLSVAQPSDEPSSLGIAVWVGAGLMLGLLAGVYIATIIDKTRRSR